MLISIFLTLIITIGTLQAVSTMLAKRNLREQVEQGIMALVEDNTKLLASRIMSEKLILDNIASDANMKSMVFGLQRANLLKYQDESDFQQLGIVNTSGIAKYTDETEEDLSDRDFIQEALAGKTVISDTFINEVSNEPVQMMASPIYKNDKVVGLVIARIDLYKLSSLVKDMGYGKGGYGFIINSEGTVIAHRDKTLVAEMFNPIQKVKQDKSVASIAGFFQTVLRQKKGVFNYNYQGTHLYSAYAEIPDSNWYYVVNADQSEVMSRLANFNQITGMIFLATLLISAVITIVLGNSITKPIVNAVKQAERIAKLDITEDIDERLLKKKDEVGLLSTALQNITESFRGIVLEMKQASVQLTDKAGRMSKMSDESAVSSEEIATTIGEIAKAAANHAEYTQEVNHKALKLGETIEQNQNNFSVLNIAVLEVVNLLEEGTLAMETLREKTAENNNEAAKIKEAANKTNESAQLIGQASETISQIAEQTNLLALNAAIEAARAGDTGKGFAVVAEEIRKLAEKSATSTAAIDKLVAELQSNTVSAVKAIEKMYIAIREQNLSVDSSQMSFQGISAAIRNADNAVRELSKSGLEMEKVKDSIIETMESLSAIAEENSASTQEVSATVEEQATSLEELASSSKNLDELAYQLEEISGRFDL